MNVFYYYYYLFYKKILKDNEPHLLTTLALSFSISLLVNGVLNITLAHTIKYVLGKWGMISILVLLLAFFYFSFYRTGKAEKIIKEQPKFFNSNRLSIILTIIFFIVTTSFMFWEAGYVGNVLGTR